MVVVYELRVNRVESEVKRRSDESHLPSRLIFRIGGREIETLQSRLELLGRVLGCVSLCGGVRSASSPFLTLRTLSRNISQRHQIYAFILHKSSCRLHQLDQKIRKGSRIRSSRASARWASRSRARERAYNQVVSFERRSS